MSQLSDLLVNIPKPYSDKARSASDSGNNKEQEGFGVQRALSLDGQFSFISAGSQTPAKYSRAEAGKSVAKSLAIREDGDFTLGIHEVLNGDRKP